MLINFDLGFSINRQIWRTIFAHHGGIADRVVSFILAIAATIQVQILLYQDCGSLFLLFSESPDNLAESESEFVPIEIRRGYSRDHRPDLKQFTLNLITSTDGDIPLGLRVGNGNEVDTKVLVPLMKQWRESWSELEGQMPQVMAGDATKFHGGESEDSRLVALD